MKKIDKEMDLGYLISSSGTVLPIRPLEIQENITRKRLSYSKGKKLYIHNEILKY